MTATKGSAGPCGAQAARRRLLAALALLGCAGCADLLSPNSLTLDEAELNRVLARQVPLQRRLAEVLEVGIVEAPRLRLLAEGGRLSIELAVQLRDRVFGTQHGARLAFDAGLRIEPSDQSLRLTQVQVRRFEPEGADAALPEPAQRIAGLLVERLLEDLTIYRLPPERVERMRRAGRVPSAVRIDAGGVRIDFAPAR